MLAPPQVLDLKDESRRLKKELEGEKKERMRMVIHPRPRPHPSCAVH